MRPAFSSSWRAAAFAALLAVLLMMPALAGKKFLPPRQEIYSSISWQYGDFPYMDEQFFREQGNMDIVFMGASHIWAAFNTPYVQEELSKELRRPAVARTFGWTSPGYDEVYFVAQDLLQSHKVRMLVINDDYNESDEPHGLASKMFRFGDNFATLGGLPLSTKAAYYLAAVAGMPRNLLSLMRTNLPADMNATSYWETRAHAPNLASRLGTITARAGFRTNPDAEPEPFSQYTPKTDVEPSDVCIYSADTKTNFDFSTGSLPPMQLYFLRELAGLAREHKCRLVIIHSPIFDERRSTRILMPSKLPDLLGQDLQSDIAIVGIPPATLFKGMTDDQIRKLYSDLVHFNENGQNYFTSLVTPSLLKIYESQTTP